MNLRISSAIVVGSMVFTTALTGGTAASAAAPTTTHTAHALAAQPLAYRIQVHTANFSNAGTDATIKMKVYGTLRDSPEYINLDNADNNFEPGRTDIFGDFIWFDIGKPEMIGVHKYGDGSDWFPEEATIFVFNELIGRLDAYHCPMSANFGSGDSTQWFDCS